MNQNQFIESFSELFEVTSQKELTYDTEFKKIDEWDSLMALETITMVDEEYDVELNGDDIRGATTIEDLYTIIKNRFDDI